jgi:hypothetical protein
VSWMTRKTRRDRADVRAATNIRKPATRARAATPARATPKSKSSVQKQLNVLIPQELHRKVKAMLEGKSMADVVEELLEGWAGEG